MESIRELYKIGNGPSSSHTMGPKRAIEDYLSLYDDLSFVKVTLYGSLALTGKGHLTDYIVDKPWARSRTRSSSTVIRPRTIPTP